MYLSQLPHVGPYMSQDIIRKAYMKYRPRRRKEIWPTLSAALQLHYITSIKPPNWNNCGLRTADCGLWTMDSGPHLREKSSSAHIVILKRFLKFAIAKIEMSNSRSLPLTPPCCEAWSPRLGNRGNPLWKSQECSSPFIGEEVVRFECSIFLTIGVPPIVVRKEIS